MRRTVLLSTAMLALSIPLSVTASDVASLDVTGAISPASCDVSLNGNDVVDLGAFSVSDFVPGEDKVDTPTLAFITIACHSGPTRYRLKLSDASGSVASTPDPSHYGLGMNGDKPIGYLRLGIRADIMAAGWFVMKSMDGGAGHLWSIPAHAYMPLEHGDEAYAMANSPKATEPAALSVLHVPLSIQAVLAKDPVVTEDVTLAGRFTIEVLY